MLVLGEQGGAGDRLMRFDEATLTQTNAVDTTAQYWGTRTSPTGTYVAVADNSVASPPIHVIEADTLATHVLPANGTSLEAMWLRGSDTLIAVFFPSLVDTIGQARIVSWSVPALQAAGFPSSPDGIWASSTLDLAVPDVGFDDAFSYTWIGVSPDDCLAVIPVIHRAPGSTNVTHELLVMDTSTGAIRTVDDAYGPVGFTPDGSTIVSYRYTYTDAAKIPQLVLINATTLEAEGMDIPTGASPAYYVTREGNDVVIASKPRIDRSAIYDVTNHAFEKVGGPPLALSSFVSRVGHDEIWLVDNGLYRLNFMTPALQAVPLTWTPEDIGILPTRDLLVLDDARSGAIRYFDPKSMSVTRTVMLPGANGVGATIGTQSIRRGL